MKRLFLIAGLIATATFLPCLLSTGVHTTHAQTFGDVEVFATVPTPPGFPEGIAVRNGIVYVSGPAAPGTAGNGEPSGVVAFDLESGEQLNLYQAQGEDLDQEHANTCIAFDNSSRLYVLNSQLSVYRLDPATGRQEIYASALPDIPSCFFSLDADITCTPALLNRMPLANDIAFAPDGTAFITDSLQATIWKVAPGGGDPAVWYQDFLLNSFIFGFVGVNGIRIGPANDFVYFTVTTNPLNQGSIYTLPLVENPEQDDLTEFHRFNRGDTPDGIAFGASGRLYAVMNGSNAKVIVLNPDGSEYGKITSPLFHSPANAAFDGEGSLLVVNHPISEGRRDPSLFMILKVFVDDVAHPLITPDIP